MHAGVHGAHAVGVRVVTDVQYLMRQHTCGLRTRHKNTHIGLGHAERLRADAGVKVLANAHAVHIGVAVRQRHHRVALAPKGQGGQRVVKQLYALSCSKKDLKGCFGQMAGVARAQQHFADGFTPQKRQIVRLVGMALGDLGAHRFFQLGLLGQGRRGRGVLHEPVAQRHLGGGDGGPNRPQGVV